jgi:type I restriction enzyme S subunit
MSRRRVVSLGSVTEQLDRYESVLPDAEYRLLGMRSKIGGPFVREIKTGTETSAQKLNRVRAGDFIYSRLFAWQGSFGLIPEDMDGCFVSNEFPLFKLDVSRIEPKFLVYWFSLPHVQQLVEAGCSGSTPGTRNRYKEEFFKALELNLPPLGEQHRIVAKIDSLAAKIEDAKRLRQSIRADMNSLLISMAHRSDLSDKQKMDLYGS